MLGINVLIQPCIFAKTIGNTDVVALSEEIVGYSHEISVDGGYRTATINAVANIDLIEQAFTSWLGRDVVVTTASGQIVFNGFINTISVSVGALSNERIGPISDICNRVSVKYSLVTYDESSGQPSVPISTVTPIQENKDSQAFYGIVEKVISVGNASTLEAIQIANMYISEYGWPEVSGSLRFDIASQESISLRIEVEGYYSWFDNYIYSDSVFGIIQISQKIASIVASDPNGVFKSSDDFIEDNPYLVRRRETDDETAWAILKRLLSYGDANNNRYTLMVKHDRYVEYKKIPESIDYYYTIKGSPVVIDAISNSEVEPMLVQPGKWIQALDWLASFGSPSLSSMDQPKNKFIESIRFTAPNTLEIIGSKTRRVGMAIAKLGLGGIA